MPASAAELAGEVQLGFLGSMTGEMAIFGENEAAATLLAVDEVNELLMEGIGLSNL